MVVVKLEKTNVKKIVVGCIGGTVVAVLTVTCSRFTAGASVGMRDRDRTTVTITKTATIALAVIAGLKIIPHSISA